MRLAFRYLLLLLLSSPVYCRLGEVLEETPAADAAETQNEPAADVGEVQKEQPEADEQAHLSDEELRAAHAELDQNGDKEASHKELQDFVRKHEKDVMLQAVDPKEEINRMDTSKDGKVSVEEYLTDVGAEGDEHRADEVEKFRAADTNGDGVLEKHELPGLIAPDEHSSLMNVTLNHSMRDADLNGDGKISLAEFTESGLGDKAGVTPMEKSFNTTAESEQDYGAEDPHESEAMEDAKNAKNLFNRLDTNKDGFLQKEELRPLESGRIAQENVVNHFVQSIDKDGDHHIDSHEMVHGKDAVMDSDLQAYLIAWARKRAMRPLV